MVGVTEFLRVIRREPSEHERRVSELPSECFELSNSVSSAALLADCRTVLTISTEDGTYDLSKHFISVPFSGACGLTFSGTFNGANLPSHVVSSLFKIASKK